MPHMEKLKACRLNARQKEHVDIIQSIVFLNFVIKNQIVAECPSDIKQNYS